MRLHRPRSADETIMWVSGVFDITVESNHLNNRRLFPTCLSSSSLLWGSCWHYCFHTISTLRSALLHLDPLFWFPPSISLPRRSWKTFIVRENVCRPNQSKQAFFLFINSKSCIIFTALPDCSPLHLLSEVYLAVHGVSYQIELRDKTDYFETNAFGIWAFSTKIFFLVLV